VKVLSDFWDFVDKRAIVRRTTLFITVYMSYVAFQWAATFATATDKDGAEVGLIIAAVTAPIAALQGYVFKLYSENRG
jgi:hypothetical protein